MNHKTIVSIKKEISPAWIIAAFIIIGILIWGYFFYCKFISTGNLDKAGQLGDSFGFFNGIALLIISTTLLYQIKEYKENKQSVRENTENQIRMKDADIENMYYKQMYETLLKEYENYNEIYIKYSNMFEEIKEGKTHLISVNGIGNIVERTFNNYFFGLSHKYGEIIDWTFKAELIKSDTSLNMNDQCTAKLKMVEDNLSDLLRFIITVYRQRVRKLQSDINQT